MLCLEPIFRRLAERHVEYVLTGSVAAAVYGAPVVPRDVDITPATAPENLHRLATILAEWRAKPKYDPDWPQVTPEDCETWTADPPTEENLDHLFDTPHGLFDVVPWRARRFEELAPCATTLRLDGMYLLVAHPRDLITTMRMNKAKHVERRPFLDAAEAAARHGTLTLRSPLDLALPE